MAVDPRDSRILAMLLDLLFAIALLAWSVVIHAALISHLMQWLSKPASAGRGFWRSTWLLVGVAFRLVLSHLVQVACWGAFYWREGMFGDFPAAAYFSIVTYTTVGYGDLVPAPPWRWTAGVEGLTGILMCGWSTAFFFAVVTRFYVPVERDATAR